MLKSIFWHPFCHPDSLILATFLLLNAACYDSNFSSPRQSPFVYISYPMRSAERDNKRWWAASRGTPILRNILRCVCVSHYYISKSCSSSLVFREKTMRSFSLFFLHLRCESTLLEIKWKKNLQSEQSLNEARTFSIILVWARVLDVWSSRGVFAQKQGRVSRHLPVHNSIGAKRFDRRIMKRP